VRQPLRPPLGLLGLTGQRETAAEGPDSRSFTRLPDGTLISLRIGTATSYIRFWGGFWRLPVYACYS